MKKLNQGQRALNMLTSLTSIAKDRGVPGEIAVAVLALMPERRSRAVGQTELEFLQKVIWHGRRDGLTTIRWDHGTQRFYKR